MAACLLASGEHLLTNVPRISDVGVMSELLVALGCQVSVPRDHELTIVVPPSEQLHPVAPSHLFEAMRASIVVLGPLLARCGEANMALPGGDDFGQRPINFHTEGLSAMGATFRNDRTSIHATTNSPRLRATRPEASADPDSPTNTSHCGKRRLTCRSSVILSRYSQARLMRRPSSGRKRNPM